MRSSRPRKGREKGKGGGVMGRRRGERVLRPAAKRPAGESRIDRRRTMRCSSHLGGVFGELGPGAQEPEVIQGVVRLALDDAVLGLRKQGNRGAGLRGFGAGTSREEETRYAPSRYSFAIEGDERLPESQARACGARLRQPDVAAQTVRPREHQRHAEAESGATGRDQRERAGERGQRRGGRRRGIAVRKGKK